MSKDLGSPIRSHYYRASTGHEAIDVILDYGLTFPSGNIVKYISRAGHKEGNSALGDLQKAIDYVDYEIGDLVCSRSRDSDSDPYDSKMMRMKCILEPFGAPLATRREFDRFFGTHASVVALAWGLDSLLSRALRHVLASGVARRLKEYDKAIRGLEEALDDLTTAMKDMSNGTL